MWLTDATAPHRLQRATLVQVYALAASAVFYLPGYRHIMTWIGCMPASRSNLSMLLSKGSVAVIVGGIAEMFMVKSDREEIKLRGRKGLMRTAIETNTPIMPVYHLGNSQILSFGPQLLKSVSRRLRTSLGLVYGKYGMPIPHQVPIHMVASKLLWPGAFPPLHPQLSAPAHQSVYACAGQLRALCGADLRARIRVAQKARICMRKHDTCSCVSSSIPMHECISHCRCAWEQCVLPMLALAPSSTYADCPMQNLSRQSQGIPRTRKSLLKQSTHSRSG
jgi:hypothetical protein